MTSISATSRKFWWVYNPQCDNSHPQATKNLPPDPGGRLSLYPVQPFAVFRGDGVNFLHA